MQITFVFSVAGVYFYVISIKLDLLACKNFLKINIKIEYLDVKHKRAKHFYVKYRARIKDNGKRGAFGNSATRLL